jgi:hypothetical protein
MLSMGTAMTIVVACSFQQKDSEFEKGQLSSQPPVQNLPPTDLVTRKDSLDNLKVKLDDRTVFTMTIFS